MNQIINMIIRQITRQLINRGLRAGINKAGDLADRRKAVQSTAVQSKGARAVEDMTPHERRQHRQARQHARQARQQIKAARRADKL